MATQGACVMTGQICGKSGCATKGSIMVTIKSSLVLVRFTKRHYCEKLMEIRMYSGKKLRATCIACK